MANQNIEMKHLNGSGTYDTLYPKTLGQNTIIGDSVATEIGLSKGATVDQALSTLQSKQSYSKDETLSNSTKTMFGLGLDSLPNDVFKKLASSVFYDVDAGTKYKLGEKWNLSKTISISNYIKGLSNDSAPDNDIYVDDEIVLAGINSKNDYGQNSYCLLYSVNGESGTINVSSPIYSIAKYKDKLLCFSSDAYVYEFKNKTLNRLSQFYNSSVAYPWLAFEYNEKLVVLCKPDDNAYFSYTEDLITWTTKSSAIGAYNNINKFMITKDGNLAISTNYTSTSLLLYNSSLNVIARYTAAGSNYYYRVGYNPDKDEFVLMTPSDTSVSNTHIFIDGKTLAEKSDILRESLWAYTVNNDITYVDGYFYASGSTSNSVTSGCIYQFNPENPNDYKIVKNMKGQNMIKFPYCYTKKSDYTIDIYKTTRVPQPALMDSFGNLIDIPSNQILDGLKIATGSYIGTGTYGQSNPNSLTFEFEPKLVIILAGSGDDYFPNRFFWVSGNLYMFSGYSGGSSGNRINRATLSENTLSWYGIEYNGHIVDSVSQGNKTGIKYSYIAIGQRRNNT